jgi:TrmH family RNA methyltransferase
MMMPFWIFIYGCYFLESKDNAKIKHLRGLIELNSARKNINKLFLKVHIFV